MPVTVWAWGCAQNPTTSAQKVSKVGAVKQDRKLVSSSAIERGRLRVGIGGDLWFGDRVREPPMLARVRPRKQLSRSRRRYQPKTAKLQIDEDIRNAVEVGAATVDEVMEFLIREGLQEQRYELARQRAQRMLTDASARRTQAEADIKHYLPPLPRSAKRLF